MLMKAVKPKKCKVCKTRFTPFRSLETWCSVPCASVLAEQKLAKKKKAEAVAERKADKEKKDKDRPLSYWAGLAQKEVNTFIRLRDAHLPCISCGRHHKGQYHAGHYLSRGARPELRFEELNIHKQCSVCNNHLSGNIVKYRINLIAKIGLLAVEWLEGPHELNNYDEDDLKAIRATYSAKARELLKEAV